MECTGGAKPTITCTPATSSHVNQCQTASGDGPEKLVSRSWQQWAEIRPRFEYLYITLDMTLRDCMAKIENEYDFHASDQMYKKRIKAWGLSKSVKAKHKDDAIADLIYRPARNRGGAAAASRSSIRTDKIIRHAQSRVKAGQLDAALLRQLQAYAQSQSNTESSARSIAQPTPGAATNINNPLPFSTDAFAWLTSPNQSQSPSSSSSSSKTNTSRRTSTTASPSASLPGPLFKFDRFLRAFRTVIAKEHTEWLTARTHNSSPPHPATIVTAFTKGMHHWSHSDFTSARICFSAAAQTFVADLQSPTGPVMSRMTYFVGAPVWDQISSPLALGFRDFMVSAARENLGAGNPLTIMLEGLGITQSLDMQLAVWGAAMDLYRAVGAEMHLYGMARMRWVWCRENGLAELAAYYREHAAEEMGRVGLLSADMVREADRDLGVLPEVAVAVGWGVESAGRGV